MTTKTRSLAARLAAHAAIGAGLGGALALWLLLRELDIFRMIADGSTPEATGRVVVASLTSIFAIGAGISGFVLMLFGDEL